MHTQMFRFLARISRAAAAVLALTSTGAALAQAPAADSGAVVNADAITQYILAQAQRVNAGRVDVSVGQLDPRLRLAPCAQMEPFIPPGARLWGRGTIGIRCTAGASWSVSLPINVRVFGPALVTTVPLAIGSVPGLADVRVEEIELTREPGSPVLDLAQIANQALTRPLAPGQSLRAEMFRAAQVIAAGDPVRVRVAGGSFTVNGEGQALNNAAAGQPVRVRVDNGRVIMGTARTDRSVEIRL
jgi:flagellar basal body P-ring formation protein FlgA